MEVTDDEMSEDESENEYQLGSFVCNDSDVTFDSMFDTVKLMYSSKRSIV